MPIYKISKNRRMEKHEQWLHQRVRLVALVVSGALFLATAALLLTYAAHRPA